MILLLNLCQPMTIACAATSQSSVPARMANPAAAKCVADGWHTETLLSDGVPSGTVCIDPISHQQCEAWAYFRGECKKPDNDQNNGTQTRE